MKILAISDIFWSAHDQLHEIITNEHPDLVILAGDVCQDGHNLFSAYSRETMRLLRKLLEQLERSKITSVLIRGNWDTASHYNSLFRRNRFQFAHDISEKYFSFKGLKFLGLPYSFFESLENLRNIKERFRKPADFIIAHPRTSRRIWVFELAPKVVIMGHDDLRICKVSSSLLITTNASPMSYALLELNSNTLRLSYRHRVSKAGLYLPFPHEKLYHPFGHRKVQENLKYEAVWRMKSRTLAWNTKEHFCYQPPYAYPARDQAYGKMLETLLASKKTKSNSEAVAELPKYLSMKAPKTLVHEYLGISWNKLRITTAKKTLD